ncbi:tetraspanin-1 [Gouania willdenowi]|uniref:tetraspanin-1 n=1 Tax=Gouania willdenowi TaxID=441366 RepID=UPI00105460BE|nr:tetraspanin-1-like [Gouania willdenowi]
MLVSNVLIALAGLALMAVGIWVSVDSGSFLTLLGPFSKQGVQFVNVGYLCIALGAVLVLLGLLGSCGAHGENKCLLLSFFSIILVIYVAEVAAAVVALAYSYFAEDILKAWATESLQNGYSSDVVATTTWNSTMTELKCCGFSNYTDLLGSKFEENEGSLPVVCCWTNIAPCSPAEAERSAVQGCSRHILESLRKHAYILGAITTAIGALEVVAMTVSMYLYCRLDNETSRVISEKH